MTTGKGRSIVVSPLSRLAWTIASHQPARLVSLHSPGAASLDAAGLPAGRVLHLAFNDIAEDRPGLVSPTLADVEALLAFAEGWREGALLVHCYAGISRSTAAALILAAALAPWRDEEELARTLRKLAPQATPNPYLVRLADARLGRHGRLARAVAAIGRGAEAFEGEPFVLPVDASTG